ncbi:hypothetical protein [Faecalibaculum rodentium]|uniref:hypothetical protein n=1 Tax=Faecalibaculum rodentium TaxID=1702221 RepID=UPI003F67D678
MTVWAKAETGSDERKVGRTMVLTTLDPHWIPMYQNYQLVSYCKSLNELWNKRKEAPENRTMGNSGTDEKILYDRYRDEDSVSGEKSARRSGSPASRLFSGPWSIFAGKQIIRV